MNFLKRVGIDLAKGIAIVWGFTPLVRQTEPMLPEGVQSALNKGLSELQQFSNIVQTVEGGIAALNAAGGTVTGQQKAVIVAPAIAQAILQSAYMVGKKVKDPVAFQAACVKLGGDWADVENAVESL